jgi:hypothetical protein
MVLFIKNIMPGRFDKKQTDTSVLIYEFYFIVSLHR